MKRFRSILFWAHLLAGAFVGAVVLVMSVTGVALTYERQIVHWADTRGMDAGPPTPGAEPLPVGELLARVEAAEASPPASITWHADPEHPVEVSFGRDGTRFVHAYTGEVLGGENPTVRAFFSTMTAWHRWLGADRDGRAVGRALTGASNLAFLFLVLSGLYLWFPRNRSRRAFRNVLAFRRGLSPKARDFNWHNVVGVWMALPLVVVIVSGVVISYPWAGDLVVRLTGDVPAAGARRGPPSRGTSELERRVELAGVDPLLVRAGEELPGWHTLTLSLSGEPDALHLTVDRGTGGEPQKRVQVTLDAATGAVVATETFADASPARQARSLLRFAHTGEVGGIAGQTLAGLASLAAALLVWTGLALAWRRLRAWSRRRRDPVQGRRGGIRSPVGAR